MGLALDLQQPVRVGIVGAGLAGQYHYERLGLRGDYRVVALFDSHEATRHICGSLPVWRSSWAEFLDTPDLDVVLIATPPATHLTLALDALHAGKHLLLETPACLNLSELDRLAAAAETCQARVCVAVLRRWSEDFRLALQCIATGELGALQTLRRVSWQFSPGPDSVVDPADWRLRTSSGGGVLWEVGLHEIDQLLQLLPGLPCRLFARSAGSTDDSPDQAMLVHLEFPGGATAVLDLHRRALVPRETGWLITGSTASFGNNILYSLLPDGEIVDVPLVGSPVSPDDFYTEARLYLCNAGSNPGSLADSRRVLRVIEAIRQSAATGEAVSVADEP